MDVIKFIKWKYLSFIESQYLKYFRGIPVRLVVQRTLACAECAKRNKCIHCGCNFIGMVVTDKKCKNYDPQKSKI